MIESVSAIRSAKIGEPWVNAQAADGIEILHGQRETVKRADGIAARQGGIRGLGLAQECGVVGEAHEGIHLRVDPVDPLQIGAHHLHAGDTRPWMAAARSTAPSAVMPSCRASCIALLRIADRAAGMDQ